MSAIVTNLNEYKKKKLDEELRREKEIADREYGEFIKLLKYFVEIQESKCRIANISKLGTTYVITDENGKDLFDGYAEEEAKYSPSGDLNYEDLLMSKLITLCPLKMFVKPEGMSKEILKTILDVFGSRVHVLDTEAQV